MPSLKKINEILNIKTFTMKKIILFISFITVMLVFLSCSNTKSQKTENKATAAIFAKGEKITNQYFTGTAWLNMLVTNDSLYNCPIGNVTFEPGARNNWHMHPGGQILLVTSGKGYHQLRGQPIELIKSGDVVKVPPGVPHWHGATPDSELIHLAISTNAQKGIVVWMEKLSDDEYDRIKL
jgi:quercetin dioxygenase-like cupin family protein